jgi:hypothetical protein
MYLSTDKSTLSSDKITMSSDKSTFTTTCVSRHFMSADDLDIMDEKALKLKSA